MKYRKKPVVIEAVQYDGHREQVWSEETPWLMDAIRYGVLYRNPDGKTYVKTLEGVHHVSNGDYVIQGVQGELYACEPNIFKQTYEPTLS